LGDISILDFGHYDRICVVLSFFNVLITMFNWIKREQGGPPPLAGTTFVLAITMFVCNILLAAANAEDLHWFPMQKGDFVDIRVMDAEEIVEEEHLELEKASSRLSRLDADDMIDEVRMSQASMSGGGDTGEEGVEAVPVPIVSVDAPAGAEHPDDLVVDLLPPPSAKLGGEAASRAGSAFGSATQQAEESTIVAETEANFVDPGPPDMGDARMHFRIEETIYSVIPAGARKVIRSGVYVPAPIVHFQPHERAGRLGMPNSPIGWILLFVVNLALLVSLYKIATHFREALLAALLVFLRLSPFFKSVTIDQLQNVFSWSNFGFLAFVGNLQTNPSAFGFLFGVIFATAVLVIRYYSKPTPTMLATPQATTNTASMAQ